MKKIVICLGLGLSLFAFNEADIKKLQKEKMLYLNMLYNMTEFGITHQFERIIYGRTAMEIKSSIGASPTPMHGFMYHTQPLINRCVPQLFKNLEPPVAWEQRHPFKEA